jgi:GDPmannose 4,6-dehydratase
MKVRKALITGITGQDGSYLAELLLANGYEVHGVVRQRAGASAANFSRISPILDSVRLHVTSFDSHEEIFEIISQVRPDECYHLAAQTFVSYAFEDEARTLDTNINGTHFLLSAIRAHVPGCHFCLAGSSEMFGRAEEVPQTETTRFHPRNAYGVSKVAAYELVRSYRETHNIFASTAILFNHESPRRGLQFVSRKVSHGVAEIAAGTARELTLGSLDAQRDWGHARDYVRAMWLMNTHTRPDDYVIATGKLHSVRQLVDTAFSICGLSADEHVRVDPAFFRPSEDYRLCGDATKAAAVLGWQPEISFEEMIREMVEADCSALGVPLRGFTPERTVPVHTSLE